MELAMYLLNLAALHKKEKQAHEEELIEIVSFKVKSRKKQRSIGDDEALLKRVLRQVTGKPSCLKKLTPAAIGALAYTLRWKTRYDYPVQGYDIIDKLLIQPERSINYLLGLGELHEKRWIRLIDEPGNVFADQQPFCWLQSKIELGDIFHKEMGVPQHSSLKVRVKSSTLFDYEEPKVNLDSLMLPEPVMEAIQAVIFSESKQGRKLRNSWTGSLPSAWGAPTGSTILLYGPPGTGKSLCAQVLATELQVPLLKVDASQVLSCWIGESEQQVKKLFRDYDDIQKECSISPVLLLNEADQLLGARDAGSHSVDRMFNNMQALFLEGLERFSGILVATTNRNDMMDSAFSRRFHYKLEIPAPDRNLRIQLWKSHLPHNRLARDVDIGVLADMGLSGGEIRLVVERAARLMAYRGSKSIDNKTLTAIAREELASRLKRTGNSARIGFGSNNY